jgi:hypothetical protein
MSAIAPRRSSKPAPALGGRPDAGAQARRQALAAADDQMSRAKEAFTRAALRCLRGELDAAQCVAAALVMVESARAALRACEATDG